MISEQAGRLKIVIKLRDFEKHSWLIPAVLSEIKNEARFNLTSSWHGDILYCTQKTYVSLLICRIEYDL